MITVLKIPSRSNGVYGMHKIGKYMFVKKQEVTLICKTLLAPAYAFLSPSLKTVQSTCPWNDTQLHHSMHVELKWWAKLHFYSSNFALSEIEYAKTWVRSNKLTKSCIFESNRQIFKFNRVYTKIAIRMESRFDFAHHWWLHIDAASVCLCVYLAAPVSVCVLLLLLLLVGAGESLYTAARRRPRVYARFVVLFIAVAVSSRRLLHATRDALCPWRISALTSSVSHTTWRHACG